MKKIIILQVLFVFLFAVSLNAREKNTERNRISSLLKSNVLVLEKFDGNRISADVENTGQYVSYHTTGDAGLEWLIYENEGYTYIEEQEPLYKDLGELKVNKTQNIKKNKLDTIPVQIQWKEFPQIKSNSIVIDLTQKQEFELSKDAFITKRGIEVSPNTQTGILISKKIKVPIESPEPFLAISASWKKEVDDGTKITISIRGSEDGEIWSEWFDMSVDEHAESQSNEKHSNLVFLDKNTRYVQYRIILQRGISGISPLVSQFRLNFISPGSTPPDVLEQIKKAKPQGYLLYPMPNYISRTGWGCPEGQRSDLLDPKWMPQITNVTHLIIHHTATSNNATDWPAVVRAIWTDHKYNNGWGDIGYNWLIDPNGVIYQGRSWWINGDDTPKDIIGAHFCGKNAYTVGIALLGTFTTVSPTTSALNSLKNILAWKCDQKGIDPLGTTYHPPTGLQLKNISGHKDGCTTECPGDNLYAQLPSIRNDVKNNISGVSARIDNYSPSTKITVSPGQVFDLKVWFTNTGSSAGYFYPGVTIWNSSGQIVFDSYGNKTYLASGSQGSYTWSTSLNTPGDYWLQFGIWDETKTNLLDKKPSPSQNLIQVVSPPSARIDNYSPSTKITVSPGQVFDLKVWFTNTGSSAGYFYPGVTIWNSSGQIVFDSYGNKTYLASGSQGSYTWSTSLNTPGDYWLQFGIWDETKTNLLDKKPSPSQNLIQVVSPTLSVNPTSLSFGDVPVGTSSNPKSYTITGSNLTSNVVINAPSGFEISTSSGGPYGSSLTLSPSSGSISATVYVRFSPTSAQSYSGNITNTSSGITRNVSVSGTGVQPTLSVNPTSLSFGDVPVGTSSIPKSYTITGSNLTSNVVINAPSGFEISTSSGGPYGSSLTLSPSSGSISATVYVRFSPTSAQSYSGNITNTSSGITRNVSVSGTGVQPTLSVNPTSLSFGDVPVGTSSIPKSYTITGSNLTSNVVINAPSGFEISTSSGGPYGSSLTLSPSSGSISATVYVRFSPTSAQSYSGNITNTSSGITRNVSVSGTGVQPTLSVNPTSLSFGDVPVGTSSIPKSYTITGSNLTSNVVINAPSGFEISTSSGGPYGSSLTLSPSSGSISATVYVRFSPTSAQSYSGNITNTSSGITRNVSVSGTGVQPTPSPPVLVSPGTNSPPGQIINTTRPTFQWQSVSGADQYGLYIEKKNNSGGWDLIFDSPSLGITITGTSYTLQDGILTDGGEYRWYMNSHNSSGWGNYSNTLYFKVVLPASISVDLSYIDFGDVQVGSFLDKNITIRNSGSGTLSVRLSISGNSFSIISGGDTFNLSSGQTRVVGIRFSPASGGSYTGTLNITHNATNQPSPITIPLSGNGVELVTHEIPLLKGWNMISSFVLPIDIKLDSIFKNIKSNLVILKDGLGRSYWPFLGVDQIGNWSIYSGYQVYMKNPDTLKIVGHIIKPETTIYSLQKGWNLISYVRRTPMDIDSALSSIKSYINIVKDNDGRVYWPKYTVNQIGLMRPGQGYLINLTQECRFSYPANERVSTSINLNIIGSTDSSYKTSSEPVHFKFVRNTGNNATVGIPLSAQPSVNGVPLEVGDEIGAFTPAGLCVGAVVWEQKNTALTVWGDDEMTPEVDGIKPGEQISYRIWKRSTDREYQATATYSLGDGIYQPNAIFILSSLSARLTPVEISDVNLPNTFVLYQNYPNPFNPTTTIKYGIPVRAHVKLEIYNILGQKVETLIDAVQEPGFYFFDIDASRFSGGVYFYRLTAVSEKSVFSDYKKMIILK
jgi:hypothetical protein